MKIAYIYDANIGNYHFGKRHPMKPHRITLTHALVESYSLNKYMDIHKPEEYPMGSLLENLHKNMDNEHNIDCPAFAGVDNYIRRYMSGSITAARLLSAYDRVINWGGGMHHAKKNEASGFCYLNDIVWAIRELLDIYNRILYLDIDIHHGDGVEEAFYDDNRVMTLSFHKYGNEYFPGTGPLFANGMGLGKGYALNVPLHTGMDDWCYKRVFEPIVIETVNKFNPEVIVMQCGADSITGDRIGCFNLSIEGHAECIRFVNKLNLPVLFLGGGGYNPEIVARAWCLETSIICNTEIDMKIPDNPFISHFGENPVLNPKIPQKHENKNTVEYLDNLIQYVFSVLKTIGS